MERFKIRWTVPDLRFCVTINRSNNWIRIICIWTFNKLEVCFLFTHTETHRSGSSLLCKSVDAQIFLSLMSCHPIFNSKFFFEIMFQICLYKIHVKIQACLRKGNRNTENHYCPLKEFQMIFFSIVSRALRSRCKHIIHLINARWSEERETLELNYYPDVDHTGGGPCRNTQVRKERWPVSWNTMPLWHNFILSLTCS